MNLARLVSDSHGYGVPLLLHARANNKQEGGRGFLSLCAAERVPLRHFTMTRKDSEKDSERTHYYSQFWLDVAAGRRIIGAPKPEDEGAESEVLEPTLPLRKNVRSSSYDDDDDAQFNGHSERIVHPVAEPLVTPEEFIESEPEEIELEADAIDTPDFQEEEVVDDMDIPDMDLGPAEEALDEDEEALDEDEEVATEEDEDEEDLGWGGRGRKRNKPVRPKVPPKKAPRREPRRGY